MPFPHLLGVHHLTFPLALAGGCAVLVAQGTDYRASIESFRAQRAGEIGGPTGWAALVDLHWVTPGTYTIGRAATNAIVLPSPSAPDRLGTIVIRPDGATLAAAAGADVRVNGRPAPRAELQPNADMNAAVSAGGLTMILIKRGDRLGLRIWDRDGAPRKAFRGLKWYPIDPAWRLDARFTVHAPVPHYRILNVLGDTIEMANPGSVAFDVHGRTYRLETFLESPDAKELFFMFRDGTSGKTTYGAGRYLYTDLPKDGHVVVDFNRAMNPPCAFTDFATCPLPPAANRLALPIPAGELRDGHSS